MDFPGERPALTVIAFDIAHADLSGTVQRRCPHPMAIAWIIEPDFGYRPSGFGTDLPDAEAPTVTIDAIANHNEGSTVTLGATLTGGTYDTVNYLWSIDSGGGSIDDPTAVTPVYTDPDVSFNTSVTLRLTITANGTGTNAADGTSATASDTEQFAVFFVADIPDAVAHAVDAGDAAFAFAVPQPSVTHTPVVTTAALVLSDFVLADGLETEASRTHRGGGTD